MLDVELIYIFSKMALKQVLAMINNTDHEALHMRYIQVAHGRKSLV